MNALVIVFACFALVGIIDGITGNHLGLGGEFEKGISLLGTLTLAMLGMLCLVPLISSALTPVILPLSQFLHLDPSVFSGMLIANDMGGAALSASLAQNVEMGAYNGLVVASMLGATVSFTIPTAIRIIPKERHPEAMLGILCGVAAIPVGCAVSGLVAGIPLIPLLADLIPICLFALIIALGLIFAPSFSVKALTLFGKLLYILIMIGLGLGLFGFLTGITLVEGLSPAREHFEMLFNLAFLLAGVFPFIKILSFILKKPLGAVARLWGINEISALGLLTTLANSTPTLGLVKDMNKKGVVINLAFAVSAAFALGDHLAFTVMFNADYTLPVVVGKIAGGVAAVVIACVIYSAREKKAALAEPEDE